MPTGPGSSNQVTKERVLGDTLVDKGRRHPEREGDALLFRARLREVVEELSEDERIILKLRCVCVCVCVCARARVRVCVLVRLCAFP